MLAEPSPACMGRRYRQSSGDAAGRRAATALGLRVVGNLSGGMFGAVLVADAADTELVLKVQPDPSLAPAWKLGAEMAELLRATGYPRARLPRDRLHRDRGLVAAGAAARCRARTVRHRPRGTARRARVPACHGLGAQPALARRRDFHFRNCLVADGSAVGVVDWEIASPGDWRFDLVNCVFWALMFPTVVDEDAVALVLDAVAAECPPDVVALMFACQALRAISMRGRVGSAEAGIVETVTPWLV